MFFKKFFVGVLLVFGLSSNLLSGAFSKSMAIYFLDKYKTNLEINATEWNLFQVTFDGEFFNNEHNTMFEGMQGMYIGETSLSRLLRATEEFKYKVKLQENAFEVFTKTYDGIRHLNEVEIQNFINNSDINANINNVNSTRRDLVLTLDGYFTSVKQSAEQLTVSAAAAWAVSRATFLNANHLKKIKDLAKLADTQQAINTIKLTELCWSLGNAAYNIESGGDKADTFSNVVNALSSVENELNTKFQGSKLLSLLLNVVKIRGYYIQLDKISQLSLKVSDNSKEYLKIKEELIASRINNEITSMVIILLEDLSYLGTFTEVTGELYQAFNMSTEIMENYAITLDLEVIEESNVRMLVVLDDVQDIQNFFLNELGEKVLYVNLPKDLGWIGKEYIEVTQETANIQKPILNFILPQNTTAIYPNITAPQGETLSFAPDYTAKKFIDCVNTATIEGIDDGAYYATANADLKWKLWYRDDTTGLGGMEINLLRNGNSFSFASPKSTPIAIIDLTYSTDGKRDQHSCPLPAVWESSTSSTGGGDTATHPIKQTGQTTSYAAFDDGHYKAGVTPSYSRSAAGVVTDNVTELEWQDDYGDNGGSIKLADWQRTLDYCSVLPLDGGGWRLPSIKELQNIVDDGRYNPTIDNTIFVNTASNRYWSSTPGVHGIDGVWCVYFDYGDSTPNEDKYDLGYVRCVRGGQ